MLDAAIWTAIKDQRTRLEKLRDDVESNGLVIPLGLCAVKSKEAFDRFLCFWNEGTHRLILDPFTGSPAYTELVEHEWKQMWNLILPWELESNFRRNGWLTVLSRNWMMADCTSATGPMFERNRHAFARYCVIERELTRQSNQIGFNNDCWTSGLFTLALEGKLAGISLKKEFFVEWEDGRPKDDIEESEHWFAVIPNAAHYSIRAIDWLIDNFEPRITLPRPSFQRNTSANLKEKQPIEVDGPTADYGFRWKGIRVDLPPRPWRLLKCMWGFESRPVGDVMSIVVDDENADWTDDAVKNALHLASDALVKAQYPKTLGRKKTDIIWK